MKIVFLVLAHKAAPLKGLVRLLGGAFDGLIHFDERFQLEDFDLQNSRFRFAEKRQPIYWGGFNMVQAELSLIAEALRTFPDCDRLVLVSGDCLPALSPRKLIEFFSDADQDFLWRWEVENDPTLFGADVQKAIERHGMVQPWRLHNYVMWDDDLTNPRERARVQAKFGVDQATACYISGSTEKIVRDLFRHMPPREALFAKFFFGQQWWGLTRRSAQIVLNSPLFEKYIHFFKYMSVPDEHFFHTILGNEPEVLARPVMQPLMFDAHPNAPDGKTGPLTLADLDFSRHGRPFVRKFDPETAPEIAALIEDGSYYAALEAGRAEMAVSS